MNNHLRQVNDYNKNIKGNHVANRFSLVIKLFFDKESRDSVLQLLIKFTCSRSNFFHFHAFLGNAGLIVAPRRGNSGSATAIGLCLINLLP